MEIQYTTEQTEYWTWHDVEQNTDAWYQLRFGKFTASSCADLMMAKTTKGYNDLIYKVAYERLFNEASGDGFKNHWTDRGHELEAQALENYQLENFVKGKNGGFCELDEWTGCSPDLILNDKLVQAKCPKFSTQIDAIINRNVPKDYFLQCQFEMMVTFKPCVDLYFWHPKLKPVTIEILRDEKQIELIKAELTTAIEKVKNIIKKIG